MSHRYYNQYQTNSRHYTERATFQNQDHAGSSRYDMVQTGEILETIMKDGAFEVMNYREGRTRKNSPKQGMQFHEVRLAPAGYAQGDAWLVNECRPEIVIANSYDCTKAFTLNVGTFRKICSNGLIVAESSIGGFHSKHINFDFGGLSRFLADLPERFKLLASRIDTLKSKELHRDEQLALAVSGLLLRHDMTTEKIDALPEPERVKAVNDINAQAPRLLSPRRYADQGNDAWSVFNRIQENLVRGRSGGIRRVASVKVENQLNQNLWQAAETIVTAA